MATGMGGANEAVIFVARQLRAKGYQVARFLCATFAAASALSSRPSTLLLPQSWPTSPPHLFSNRSPCTETLQQRTQGGQTALGWSGTPSGHMTKVGSRSLLPAPHVPQPFRRVRCLRLPLRIALCLMHALSVATGAVLSPRHARQSACGVRRVVAPSGCRRHRPQRGGSVYVVPLPPIRAAVHPALHGEHPRCIRNEPVPCRPDARVCPRQNHRELSPIVMC